jgi:hypothetical protein
MFVFNDTHGLKAFYSLRIEADQQIGTHALIQQLDYSKIVVLQKR